MLSMMLARNGVSISRTIACIPFWALFIISSAQARQWDTAGAARAFEEARQKRSELSQSPQPVLSLYFECVKAYRKVHGLDPHFGHTPDAIFEEGLVYQEMGDKFGDLNYYKTAVSRFHLLVQDYGGSRNCPAALLRAADIYTKHLEDENAAQETYQILKTRYKQSDAARELGARTVITKPTPEIQTVNIPSETPVSAAPVVQNVSYSTINDYLRVSIDMNLDARYSKQILSNPGRIYFDIFNAQLSGSLPNSIISVDSDLLKKIRIAQNRPDMVRVVLDLPELRNYSIAESHNPFRIVIDLYPSAESKAAATKNQPFDSKRRVDTADLRTAPERKAVNESQSPKAVAASAPQTQITKPAPGTKTLEAEKQPPPLAITEIQSTVSTQNQTQQRPATAVLETQTASVRNNQTSPQPSVAGAAKPQPPKTESPAAKKPTDVPARQNETLKVSSVSADNQKTLTPTVIPSPSKPKQEAQSAKNPAEIENRKVPASPAPDIRPESSKITKPVPANPGNVVEQKNESQKDELSSKSLPATSPKAAPPTSFGDRTLTRMLGLKIGRIVIDPGHGGYDLGTVGPGGLFEKDIVLSIAHDLQNLIQEQLGAEVFLTRNDDSFISLEERTTIANQHRADLFISIHANSSRNRSISGVETYYLDFAKSDTEREIAARENATTASSVHELEDLIKKIAKADKSAESRELASIVQKNLYSGAHKLFPAAQNRGVRSAPFIVLIGANMPSVLTEVAFISNPRDERLLKKSANQERLVKALFSGIEDYMKALGSDLVQNQTKK
jgi:N-acetylmuramoyl-L-alanine amidase